MGKELLFWIERDGSQSYPQAIGPAKALLVLNDEGGDGLTMSNIYCSLSDLNEKDVDDGEHDESAEWIKIFFEKYDSTARKI